MTNGEKRHKNTKITLRIIGISLLIGGLVLTVLGIIDMVNFSMENGEHMPGKIWMLFLGFPMIAIGAFTTITSFHREVSEYFAKEHSPIVNMMAKSVQPAVKDISEALSDGMENRTLVCPYCGKENEKGDIFCSECGKELYKTCKKCGSPVKNGDKFCGKCGERVE